MPGGDGTGPMGMGPMTGRAAGYCAGYGMPGYMNPVGGRWAGYGRTYGRGFGMGFGRAGAWGGRGRRNWFYATGLTGWQRAAAGQPAWGAATAPVAAAPWSPALTSRQQLDLLKGQAEHLEDALAGVRRRIEELENTDKQPRGSE